MRPVALALLAALAVACGPAPVAPSPSPRASAGHPTWRALRAATDLDGRPVAAHVPDGAPLVVVVFASWCSHCRRELAILDELRRLEPGVAIVGLNYYEAWGERSDEAQLRAYVGANAPWLPVVRGTPAMIADLGGVPKIPSVFVFDGGGELVQRWKRNETTPPTLDELRAALARMR
jgi:thiol-disulfide isomerase/thioredoxin